MNVTARVPQKRPVPAWKRGWPWQEGAAGRFSPFKAAILVLLLLPALWLLWRTAQHDLGPRPLTELILQTGTWGIRLLLVSLFVTPLRQILRHGRLALVRRMIGVAAGSYLVTHFILYTANQAFDLDKIVTEIIKANYLIIGLCALTALLLLLATSTDGMLRRLGGRRWQLLHRLVFPAAALGAWHYFLQVKADIFQPLLIIGFLAWLFGYRLWRWQRPQGATLPVWALALLGLGAALLTVAGEAAYFSWKIGAAVVPRVLEANLNVEMGVRPGIWVLLAATGVTLAAGLATIRARRS
ncbi:MAG: ferric reductase-like transmembrane domain-containing protein [Ferrovibrio sp.]|uniref:sulfite oxidase heme-binding subunit YedZ n=1 Tax=Ferrovibrio sp. TaxID=1917215 RepID=UPI00260BE5E0|nr:ferric reductase-like transmembrane domain-containing protein [Ferrovibrio sp.]MCW0233138.1 ferric reductase-like transmembrane domain-containing protein [Ferrovibrio sp.]